MGMVDEPEQELEEGSGELQRGHTADQQARRRGRPVKETPAAGSDDVNGPVGKKRGRVPKSQE